MKLEIRPIKSEELNEFNRLIGLSFAAPPQFRINMPPEWSLCGFADGKMVTTYAACPLTMQFNGISTVISGITVVTTMPVYRRLGILRKITETHFKMLYEEGKTPISALNASNASIYQRYGYGIVSFKNAYTIEPQFLKFALKNQVDGKLSEVSDKDNIQLLDLYHKFIEKRNGYLQRNENFEVSAAAPFTVMNFPPPSPVPAVKLIYSENDINLGYVIYSFEPNFSPIRGAAHRLVIRDLVWFTPSAYQAIWEHMMNMDLVREISWARVPVDDPLPFMLLEPKMLGSVTTDGLLARIIDVEKAMIIRPYSGEGKLTFEIADEVCPWNTGRWQMETSGSNTAVTRTKEKAQVTIPVSTLAMLMFGQLSATEAARMGRLDVHDFSSLQLWDRLMKTEYKPFCGDMF